jgi:hypothetical protein
VNELDWPPGDADWTKGLSCSQNWLPPTGPTGTENGDLSDCKRVCSKIFKKRHAGIPSQGDQVVLHDQLPGSVSGRTLRAVLAFFHVERLPAVPL